MNLRGQIVPIVDLCKRFETKNGRNADESQRRIIVVNMGNQNIGILVDGVSEILRIPDESIEPTPPIVASGVSSDFIRGVAKVANRLIIVLDLDRIYANHFLRNPASGRVMQKAGMKHEGCLRQHVLKWGAREDLEVYGILKAEHRPPGADHP